MSSNKEAKPAAVVSDSKREVSRRCVACKQEIPSSASLCSICKSYQRSWKNHLQYSAGIATLAVLILSGSAWLVDKAHKTFFSRDDVRVVGCNTLGSAVIVNRGDREVFLSHLLLWMPGRTSNWVAPDLPINESLPPGQFLKRDYSFSRIKGTAYFVRGLSADEFQKQIERATNGDPCVEVAFYSSVDGNLPVLQTMATPTLNTFEVAGYLEYWGQRDQSAKKVPLTGIGVLRHDSKPECK